MTVLKKKNNWYYRFKLDGREYYRACKGATTKREAEQFEAIVKAELMRGNTEIISKKVFFEEAATLYLNYSKNNKKSTANDIAYTNLFLKKFKNMHIEKITPAVIENFKTYMINQDKWSNATINRYLQALSKLFNLAVDNNMVKSNPMSKVKKLKVDNHMIRVLTKDEQKRLMMVLPKCLIGQKSSLLKLIVVFALKTGARKREILNLTWKQVDFKNRVFELLVTKSGKKRKIPLAKSLCKILKKLKANTHSEYVFTNPITGKPYNDIKKRFNTALKLAQIKNFRFHDLRHTFATRLIEKGVDIVVVKELLGHADIKTTMIYVHSDEDRKRKAISTIDRY